MFQPWRMRLFFVFGFGIPDRHTQSHWFFNTFWSWNAEEDLSRNVGRQTNTQEFTRGSVPEAIHHKRQENQHTQ
uniref:Uncharacterized protein n=1 Tax=Anguilla anguilla TaxID=7936 RepID=A0A0E9WEE6_ANGAN